MKSKGYSIITFCFGLGICVVVFGLLRASQCLPENDCISRIPPEKIYEYEIDCGAREFQNLVGRKDEAVLKTFYPANTNLYYLEKMPNTPLLPNRLNIEIGRDRRITRVFCT